jgi:hypothetical protein
VTVRKSSPNAAWADTYVSAALSGVTELHGKWCTGRGCNSGSPGVMFQGGEEFWVYLKFVGQKQHCILSAHPDVALRRRCTESFRQIAKPLGEFVHPPLRLAFELDSPELISGVYIDPLTSRELRKKAGNITASRTPTFPVPRAGDGDAVISAQLLNKWAPSNGAGFAIDPASLERLADLADDVYAIIPDAKSNDGTGSPEANYQKAQDFGAQTNTFRAAIGGITGAADLQQVIKDNFADTKAVRDVYRIFVDRATASRAPEPGFRLSRTQNTVIAEPSVITGYPDIPKIAFDFFGGNDRSTSGKTRSADQPAALSGHGVALVTA